MGVLSPYVVTHHLEDFWYYFVRYGREVYMAPVTLADVRSVLEKGVLRSFPLNLFLATFLLKATWFMRVRHARHGRTWWFLLLGHVLISIPASTFTGRYFGHYFLQVDMFLTVGFALALFGVCDDDDLRALRWQDLRLQPRIAMVSAAILGVVALPLLFSGQNRRYEELSRLEFFPLTIAAHEPIGDWIRRNTDPDDRVFVWGLRGDVYLNANRKPASRFVYTLFPSGLVPWYDEPLHVQQARVVPGSQEALIADLEASRAEIIVDVGNSTLDRFMTHYPMLRAYIERNYCLEVVLRHPQMFRIKVPPATVPVYRRRSTNEPCNPTN